MSDTGLPIIPWNHPLHPLVAVLSEHRNKLKADGGDLFWFDHIVQTVRDNISES